MTANCVQGLTKAKATLGKLVKEANLFREEHPHARGVSKFCKRIRKGKSYGYRVRIALH